MSKVRWSRLLIALIGASLVFGTTIGRERTRRSALGEFVPVRPELTKVIMKSCLPMVVDIYWLRAINAVGTAQTEAEFKNLAEYGRVLDTLDPEFAIPYWFIGIAIPYNRAREDWVNGKESIALLEKGVAHHPNDLRLKLLLGYSLMTFTPERHADAAKVFEEASKLPGAPDFAALLATRLYLSGNQYDTALSLAQSLRDEATSEEERERFSRRVQELLDEKVLREMDAAGATFKEREGRWPANIDELVKAGLAQKPTDPRYEQLRFDAKGRALLPDSHGRLKLFHDTFGGRDDDAPETWR